MGERKRKNGLVGEDVMAGDELVMFVCLSFVEPIRFCIMADS